MADILEEAQSRLEAGRRAFREGAAEARQRLTEELARARRGEPGR